MWGAIDLSTTTIKKKQKTIKIPSEAPGKSEKDRIHKDLVGLDMLLNDIQSFTVLPKILQSSQAKKHEPLLKERHSEIKWTSVL